MIQELLDDLHAKYKACDEGTVKELTQGDPSHFGLAITSRDGTQWAAGDCATRFTIQSLAKPLVYAVGLGLLGEEAVRKYVGVEPSGEPYNAIELEEETGRPANAMLNAGALATCALLLESYGEAGAWKRIHEVISGAVGRSLEVDEVTMKREQKVGHRHHAMVHLMVSQGVVKAKPDTVVNLYFRQCSLLLDCCELSLIGATLANRGQNPKTGEAVFKPWTIQDMLSVMLTCGMYDSAGNWVVQVGIPAKSGIAGGLLGVVNRQVGIATYSPPLNAEGHSVRGIRAITEISEKCALHAFHHQNHGSNFLREAYELRKDSPKES